MIKIKTITVRQPWAECTFTQGKNVENRNWSTKLRGWVGIHASGSRSRNEFELCKIVFGPDLNPDEVAYGSVIGFAKITDVITKETVTEKTKKWFQGDYAFVIDEVMRLPTPVKVKGSLGFWDLEGAPLQECLDQLSPSDLERLEKDVAVAPESAAAAEVAKAS